jgi:two-component sensor histidine kinase
MHVRRLLLILVWCFLSSRVAAVGDSLQYQRYDVNNGLPSNNAYCCMQDRQGYRWIATDKGVVKYNGYTFKVFNSYSGLPGDDFYGLQEDNRNRMWIYGISNHFGFIHDDHYHDVASSPLLYRRVGLRDAISIYGKRVILNEAFTNSLLLADTVVEAVFPLPANYNFILNDNGFLFGHDPVRKKFLCWDIVHPFVAPRRLNEYAYAAFRRQFAVSQVDFWLDSLLYSCTRFGRNMGRLNFNTGKFTIHNITDFGAAPDEHIYIYHVYSASLVYVLTNKRLYLLNGDLHVLAIKEFPPATVKNMLVAFWNPDEKGNEWFATTAEGVLYRPASRNCIRELVCLEDIRNTRFTGAIGNYSYWWDGTLSRLYQMDVHGGLRWWEIKGLGRIESITALNDQELCLSFAATGRILNMHTGKVSMLGENSFFKAPVGSFYNRVSHSTYTPTNDINSILGNQKAMSFYRDTQLVCLSGDPEVMTITLRNGRLDRERMRKDYCSHLLLDSFYNKYIIYGADEVFVYDPSTRAYCRFGGFDHVVGQVIGIRTDRWGNVFILGTQKLGIFNLQKMRWYRIDTRVNLAWASIEIIKDKLVLLGSFGVAAAEITGPGSIGPLHVSCNIRSHFYKQISYSWTDNGSNVIARTDRGWIRVHIPELMRNDTLNGRLQIGSFSLVMNAPLSRKLGDGDTVKIAAGTKRLIADAINYYGSGNVRYSYKVAEGPWQQSLSGELLLDKETPETYYTMQVQVQDDSWHSGIITLYLYNQPFWWQTKTCTILFWILGIVLLLALIMLTIYITSRVVARANEKRRMLTDLELRAIHAQINPHFIFNTLSTALYFISRREYDNAYGHVNKFSHLLRSYLKSSHDRYVLLSEEIDMLKRYVDLQQTRFEEKFDFELNVDNKIPVNNIQIPSLLLQPLVENAINHGLFHRKDKGLLKLSFGQGTTSDHLIVIIDDNGIGRAEAMRLKQESAADKESYGSQLTQKLMDIFRRYEAMDIEIQYIDKELPQTGTIVRLMIGNIRYIV